MKHLDDTTDRGSDYPIMLVSVQRCCATEGDVTNRIPKLMTTYNTTLTRELIFNFRMIMIGKVVQVKSVIIDHAALR